MTKVFISYAREDLEIASALFEELKHAGFDPWLDKKSLKAGERWEPAIQKAIRSANYFIALLSTKSVPKKGYVQKELRLAMDVLDTIPEDQIFIIPARLEDCEPTHERLRELNWVDLFPDRTSGISAIVRVIGFTPKEVFQTSLANTTWRMTKNGTRGNEPSMLYDFKLHADGTFTATKKFAKGARWRQSGRIIYMEINDSYAQLRGALSEDQHSLSGDAQNVAGKKWDWEAVKVEA